MYIRVIEDTQAFASLGREWNELVDRSGQPDIFLTHDWLFTWWEVYGSGKELYILLCFENNNELAGILPAYRKRKAALPGAWSVRLLGSENVTTDFLSCIAARGKEYQVYDAVFNHLLCDRRRWSVIELSNVEVGAPLHEYLNGDRSRLCGTALQTEPVKCPYTLLPGDWKTFLQSLSFKARKKTRYYRNTLAKKGGAALRIVNDGHSLDSALLDVMSLHRNSMARKGWKERFSCMRYREFYRKICRRFHARGWLRLSFLEVDGRRVAFLNGFKYGYRMYAYHTGFDTAWSDLSAGFLLLGYIIESAILEGCTRFEFLRGDQRYKYEWGITGEREITDLSLYDDSPLGKMFRFASSTLNGIKRISRRGQLPAIKGHE